MEQELASKLEAVVKAGKLRFDEPLAAHTTFKIGGPAECFAEPATVEELSALLALCGEAGLPWRILGCGSDLLVDDAGVEGVVISTLALADIEQQGEGLVVGAGATNADVAAAACAAGLSGYEFACGIPGTVGGAAIMNAGAYDGEFAQVCSWVECLDAGQHVVRVVAADADWSYRHSVFDEKGMVVLRAYLALAPDDPAAIQGRMDDLAARREAKQPIYMPSAGSTFKRPQGHYAAALIDEAGLRGFSVGGAQVSTKHTGFVVNAGHASSADVHALIAEVQKRVYEASGVHLEPEVRFWG